jgi:hypothetical protein
VWCGANKEGKGDISLPADALNEHVICCSLDSPTTEDRATLVSTLLAVVQAHFVEKSDEQEDREQRAEDREETAEETAEDREQTAEDREETAEDREQTAEDREQTAEDREQTAEDREQTAEDREQTKEDRGQAGNCGAVRVELVTECPKFPLLPLPKGLFSLELDPQHHDAVREARRLLICYGMLVVPEALDKDTVRYVVTLL